MPKFTATIIIDAPDQASAQALVNSALFGEDDEIDFPHTVSMTAPEYDEDLNDEEPKREPYVVVEGGLVQYQSGDWGGPLVHVVDLDFIKHGDEDSTDEAIAARDVLREHVHPFLPDGADLPRVEAWLGE